MYNAENKPDAPTNGHCAQHNGGNDQAAAEGLTQRFRCCAGHQNEEGHNETKPYAGGNQFN